MEVQNVTEIKTKEIEGLLKAAEEEKAQETKGAEGDFSQFMKAALGGEAKTEVNEEELFSSLIEQRLTVENAEAAEVYKAERAKLMVSMRRDDGYVSVEDVSVAALKATVESGKLEQADAERINAVAFSAAQLDDNKDALYDSRGSAEDPTIAVSAMDAALLAMKSAIDQIENGEVEVGSRPLDTPSNTTPGGSVGGGGSISAGEQNPMDGNEGFLWKPVSESDGNLVVLLPAALKGMIDRVEIHSDLPPTESTKIDEGRFAGDEHNGGRPHFRFSESGEDYGSNVHVVVFKDDGSTVTYSIADGSQRYD